MQHLMHNHVLQKVPWLLDKLGVQEDAPSTMVAAAPFRFHSTKKIRGHCQAQLFLPLTYQRRHRVMKQCLVPIMDNGCSLFLVAAGANGKLHTAVVNRNISLAAML